MKKLIVLIIAILCISSCCCSTCSYPIYGNEYEVTKVEVYPHSGYKYTVTMKCLDARGNGGTFNGNWQKFYTNDIYTVGDTITIK